jgi:hypothetical protein
VRGDRRATATEPAAASARGQWLQSSPRTASCIECGAEYDAFPLAAEYVRWAKQEALANPPMVAAIEELKAKDGVYVHSLHCVPCTRDVLANKLDPIPLSPQEKYIRRQREIEEERMRAPRQPGTTVVHARLTTEEQYYG